MKLNLADLPKVTIFGRPNVGKSSLFNRLIKKRKSIVQRESGTTRDRVYEQTSWRGKSFVLVDSGGFKLSLSQEMEVLVNREVEKALEEAVLVLFVTDVSSGLVPLDEGLADYLRKKSKQIILVVNKVDSASQELDSTEFYRLGFSELQKVSALHGQGIGELLEKIVEKLPEVKTKIELRYLFTITIVGEPNVGKSTFFNVLLEEERAIVSELPGTTRDLIEEVIEFDGSKIKLVDTAGLRRRKEIKEPTVFFSLIRTQKAIREADIVIMLFDSTVGFTRTSKSIFNQIVEEKKGLILVANKWDLVKDVTTKAYTEALKREIGFIADYPIIFISALKREYTLKPLEEALSLWKKYSHFISTHQLNEFLQGLKSRHTLPPAMKIKYMVQTGAKPPQFLIFVKNKKLFSPKHLRFLKNQIVSSFDLNGINIALALKEEKNTDEQFANIPTR